MICAQPYLRHPEWGAVQHLALQSLGGGGNSHRINQCFEFRYYENRHDKAKDYLSRFRML